MEHGGAPNAVWQRILERHDPDVVIDLVGAAKEYCEEHEQLGRSVIPWTHPTETMVMNGALVDAGLRRRRSTRLAAEVDLTINFDPIISHLFALPLAFRFGHLDRRPLLTPLASRAQEYAACQHSDFVTVSKVDPNGLDEDAMMRYLCDPSPDLADYIHPLLPRDMVKSWTLPELTGFGIPVDDRATLDWRYGVDHECYEESYFRYLVVVGDPNSVPDLCLAWNLRAQRRPAAAFLIWIPANWLSESRVLAGIEMAVKRDRPQRELGDPCFRLVSASLPATLIQSAATGFRQDFSVYDRSVLDRLFRPDFRVGAMRTSGVSFHNGVAHVALPDPAELADFASLDFVAWAAAIEGYRVPIGQSLDYIQLGIIGRMASDGLTKSDHAGGWSHSLSIGIADGQRIVDGVTLRAGYRAGLSSNGRKTRAVLDLLGGLAGLELLASSRVYDLLIDMAEIVLRQAIQRELTRQFGREMSSNEAENVAAILRAGYLAEGQFDRQHMTWGQLKKALAIGDDAVPIVEWLVEKRILLRGSILSCQKCELRRWYPVNRLAETVVCDGCRAESSRPLGVRALNWSYRLNELVAHAVDQGVLPQLLAGRRLARENWNFLREDFLGFTVGLELEAIDSSSECEVDVFAINAGRVILCECKAQGRSLADKDIIRDADLAARFRSPRVVYATVTRFDDVQDLLEKARELNADREVQVWQRDDLLDVRLDSEQPHAMTADKYLRTIASRCSMAT